MAAADTIKPVLTSLVIPQVIDVTGGDVRARFQVGASDAGGVENVFLSLDRAYPTGFGRSSSISFSDTQDSFADGVSARSELFTIATAPGTYTITGASVGDKAGNYSFYSAADLRALGFDLDFEVRSNAALDATKPVLTSITIPQVIDVREGGVAALLQVGATDSGSGIESVSVSLDRSYQTSFGRTAVISFSASNDSFDDGVSARSEVFTSATAPGTYAITGVTVGDKAGNFSFYTAADLRWLGIDTDFEILSNASVDTVKPTLTSLSLPQAIDITTGGVRARFTAGASDAGSGVESVFLQLDRPLRTSDFSTVSLGFYGTVDSFDDGASAFTSLIPTTAAAGTYNVLGVTVVDKAGNSTLYSAAELKALGIDTDFDVIDRNVTVTPTVSIAAPTSVREGEGGFGLQLKFASLTSYAGTIELSLASDSTATNGRDVNVPTTSAFLSVNQTPAQSFTYDFGRFSLLSDRVAEGAETIAIRIKVPGQVFADGTDSTIVRIALEDNATATHQNVVNDFNGDGHGDILWRSAAGAVSSWHFTGDGRAGGVQQNRFLASVDVAWRIVETADFNGDNHSDILWRHADGTFSIWNATDNGFAPGSYTDNSVSNEWRIAGTGDINGDARDDLFWQRGDGAVSAWHASGTGFAANSYFHASPGASWKVDGLGDFNGDGLDDLLWRNDNGAVSTWNAVGGGFAENSYFNGGVGRAWQVAGLGDVSGDGRDDIIWQNDNGDVSVWRATVGGFTQNSYYAAVDRSWHVEQLADYNGDGRADILFRNDNGAISTWLSDGTGFIQNAYSDASAGPGWSIAAHDFLL